MNTTASSSGVVDKVAVTKLSREWGELRMYADLLAALYRGYKDKSLAVKKHNRDIEIFVQQRRSRIQFPTVLEELGRCWYNTAITL